LGPGERCCPTLVRNPSGRCRRRACIAEGMNCSRGEDECCDLSLVCRASRVPNVGRTQCLRGCGELGESCAAGFVSCCSEVAPGGARLTCTSGRCAICKPAGESCLDPSECCSGNGTCGGGPTNPRFGVCVESGCALPGQARSLPCCFPESIVRGGVCCQPSGTNAYSDSADQCCDRGIEPRTLRCCVPEGIPARDVGLCCQSRERGALLRDGRCTSCVASGQPASMAAQCCPGTFWVNGICQGCVRERSAAETAAQCCAGLVFVETPGLRPPLRGVCSPPCPAAGAAGQPCINGTVAECGSMRLTGQTQCSPSGDPQPVCVSERGRDYCVGEDSTGDCARYAAVGPCTVNEDCPVNRQCFASRCRPIEATCASVACWSPTTDAGRCICADGSVFSDGVPRRCAPSISGDVSTCSQLNVSRCSRLNDG
jgi:hypothetical protein